MCKITDPVCSPPVSPCGRGKPMTTVVVMTPTNTGNDSNEAALCATGRKRVRFGSDVKHVYEKDFTQDDVHHIWYNCDEFNAIKSEIYAMIRSVNTCNLHLRQEYNEDNSSNNNCDIDRKFHWRGFEHVRQKRPRKEIRQRHTSNLLYFYHRMRGNDPIRLGLFALNSSRDCLERARLLAMMDESEAMAIYHEDGDDETQSQASTAESSSVTSAYDATTEEQEVEDNTCSVNAMTICRVSGDEESNTIHLLHEHHPQVAPLQDDSAFSLFLVTFKLVIMLFPCLG